MQIDQARVAIHERMWLENLDLALHVARTHFAGVAACALVGILPIALLNYVLIARGGDRFEQSEWGIQDYWTTILVMIEAPLATAPITLYLGQALFLERPSARRVVREFFASLPQLLVLQVALRTLLIVPVITWAIPYAVWPYLNEVILLERNPLFFSRSGMSTLARNRWLHSGNGGDYLLRAIGGGLLAVALLGALFGTQTVLLSWLLGIEVGAALQAVLFQASLWLVAVFFTIARFLAYLDGRIRNEGWEVELFLRAQRDRLQRQIA
jgi:hypothetical protein